MALNLPLDENLAASIHRRRIAEEQRKQRIFDSKRRQIGIDVRGLNQQVHESLFKRTCEEEKEKKFAEQVINNDRLAMLLEQQKNENLLKLNKNIDDFRLTVQRPEYRRDFDLYDPDLKKKERPPRISDNDPCPISNVQKLEGEVLNSGERTRKQKDQVKDILLQQMQEKRLENFKKDKEMHDWERNLLNQDKNALKLAMEEEANNRRAIQNLKTENKMMSLQTVERKMQQKLQEEIFNKKDIEYNYYGSLLSEDAKAGVENFKGMTQEQLDKIFQGQLQQIEENQRKREREQQERAVWDQTLINQAKTAAFLDEENKRRAFNLNKNLELSNQMLSQEQRMCIEFNNKVGFKNKITDDYFLQFNTTTR